MNARADCTELPSLLYCVLRWAPGWGTVCTGLGWTGLHRGLHCTGPAFLPRRTKARMTTRRTILHNINVHSLARAPYPVNTSIKHTHMTSHMELLCLPPARTLNGIKDNNAHDHGTDQTNNRHGNCNDNDSYEPTVQLLY